MTRLSPAEVDRRLTSLSGWKREGDFITKSFKFKTFMEGISFVNDLAAIAERIEHHPDIHIRWTTVRLEVQTHDEGGVTPRDIKLATEIEKSLKRDRGKGREPRRSVR